MNNPNYLRQALAIFNQLSSNGQGLPSQNYWQLGCTLDTCIDLLREAIAAGQLVTPVQAQTFMGNMLQTYRGLAQPYGGLWYDDFGWWGIAASKALDPLTPRCLASMRPTTKTSRSSAGK